MFDWFSFSVYVLVASITPGPNNILAMSQASWVGFKHTFPFNCGVFFGMVGVSALCSFLTLFMKDTLPIIMEPLLYIGAIYILYLAYKTYTSTGKIESGERKTNNGAPIGVGIGTLLQFVNPKAYIFTTLCLEAYVLPYYSTDYSMLALLCIVFALFGFFSTIAWALFGSAFRVLFSKHARITNTVMALLLVYCAVSFFI